MSLKSHTTAIGFGFGTYFLTEMTYSYYVHVSENKKIGEKIGYMTRGILIGLVGLIKLGKLFEIVGGKFL